jgi:pyruvate dehydrogenase E2 component (dihydrolipoamide acetyltransferase)
MPEFTLPELGENVASGDVLRVLVKPGDILAKEQPVIELETDKATVEVPSSVAGRITEVKVKAGDKVHVGQAILSVEDGVQGHAQGAPSESAVAPAQAEPKTSETPAEPAAQKSEAKPEKPEPHAPEPRGRAADAARAKDISWEDGGPQPRVETATGESAVDTSGVKKGSNVVDIARGARRSGASRERPPAPASPSVRRLAREVGVDIDEIAGTGPDGRISIEDVKAHTKQVVEGPRPAGGAAAISLPDFSRWGEVERQPMRAVRRATAQHLTAAWTTIPHVTQHHIADITRLDELRKRYAKETEDAGGELTITAIAIKVCAAALKVFPQFNASVDMAAEEIIIKKYVNIGVAVDTDRGLLVPVVKNADAKNIIELAVELSQLSEKARSRKITLEEMQGGCFSISNLGGIGGTYFTPIINLPEVAILGISRARTEPVWKDGAFVPRLMLPLSLSYDHRVIDGAEAARFIVFLSKTLSDVKALL